MDAAPGYSVFCGCLAVMASLIVPYFPGATLVAYAFAALAAVISVLGWIATWKKKGKKPLVIIGTLLACAAFATILGSVWLQSARANAPRPDKRMAEGPVTWKQRPDSQPAAQPHDAPQITESKPITTPVVPSTGEASSTSDDLPTRVASLIQSMPATPVDLAWEKVRGLRASIDSTRPDAATLNASLDAAVTNRLAAEIDTVLSVAIKHLSNSAFEDARLAVRGAILLFDADTLPFSTPLNTEPPALVKARALLREIEQAEKNSRDPAKRFELRGFIRNTPEPGARLLDRLTGAQHKVQAGTVVAGYRIVWIDLQNGAVRMQGPNEAVTLTMPSSARPR